MVVWAVGLLLAVAGVLAFGRMQCAPTEAECAGVGDLVGVGVALDDIICVDFDVEQMVEDALFSGVFKVLVAV